MANQVEDPQLRALLERRKQRAEAESVSALPPSLFASPAKEKAPELEQDLLVKLMKQKQKADTGVVESGPALGLFQIANREHRKSVFMDPVLAAKLAKQKEKADTNDSSDPMDSPTRNRSTATSPTTSPPKKSEDESDSEEEEEEEAASGSAGASASIEDEAPQERPREIDHEIERLVNEEDEEEEEECEGQQSGVDVEDSEDTVAAVERQLETTTYEAPQQEPSEVEVAAESEVAVEAPVTTSVEESQAEVVNETTNSEEVAQEASSVADEVSNQEQVQEHESPSLQQQEEQNEDAPTAATATEPQQQQTESVEEQQSAPAPTNDAAPEPVAPSPAETTAETPQPAKPVPPPRPSHLSPPSTPTTPSAPAASAPVSRPVPPLDVALHPAAHGYLKLLLNATQRLHASCYQASERNPTVSFTVMLVPDNRAAAELVKTLLEIMGDRTKKTKITRNTRSTWDILRGFKNAHVQKVINAFLHLDYIKRLPDSVFNNVASGLIVQHLLCQREFVTCMGELLRETSYVKECYKKESIFRVSDDLAAFKKLLMIIGKFEFKMLVSLPKAKK